MDTCTSIVAEIVSYIFLPFTYYYTLFDSVTIKYIYDGFLQRAPPNERRTSLGLITAETN